MKIFLTASKASYDRVDAIRSELQKMGHVVTPPNGFDEPENEVEHKRLSPKEYADWKSDMIRKDGQMIAAHDAVLVLNFDKNGQQNYIGGATFLEMFKAFDLGKKLFVYHPIPNNTFADEIVGLQPIVINEDLSLIV